MRRQAQQLRRKVELLRRKIRPGYDAKLGLYDAKLTQIISEIAYDKRFVD